MANRFIINLREIDEIESMTLPHDVSGIHFREYSRSTDPIGESYELESLGHEWTPTVPGMSAVTERRHS